MAADHRDDPGAASSTLHRAGHWRLHNVFGLALRQQGGLMNWLCFAALFSAFVLALAGVPLWWLMLAPAVLFGIFSFLREEDFSGF